MWITLGASVRRDVARRWELAAPQTVHAGDPYNAVARKYLRYVYLKNRKKLWYLEYGAMYASLS